jgi:hypothetical protein
MNFLTSVFSSQFFLLVPLGTLSSAVVASQNSQAYCSDPKSRNDQGDPPEERHLARSRTVPQRKIKPALLMYNAVCLEVQPGHSG